MTLHNPERPADAGARAAVSHHAPGEGTALFDIRHETPLDIAPRERLLDRCFGPDRFVKTCERLREGRVPAIGLSLVVTSDDGLAATVRLWNVSAGRSRPALMLGPLAVDPDLQGIGVGSTLVRDALGRAHTAGHGAVLLVGDAPYYARFGFTADATDGLWLPGPVERERFLGLELRPGALEGARGIVTATGRWLPAARDGVDVGATALPMAA